MSIEALMRFAIEPNTARDDDFVLCQGDCVFIVTVRVDKALMAPTVPLVLLWSANVPDEPIADVLTILQITEFHLEPVGAEGLLAVARHHDAEHVGETLLFIRDLDAAVLGVDLFAVCSAHN